MSELANDGGAAFPQPGVYHPNHRVVPVGAFYDAGGMSLRDYFAAKAMEAELIGWHTPGVVADPFEGDTPYHIAERAYLQADAMLRVREVKSK